MLFQRTCHLSSADKNVGSYPKLNLSMHRAEARCHLGTSPLNYRIHRPVIPNGILTGRPTRPYTTLYIPHYTHHLDYMHSKKMHMLMRSHEQMPQGRRRCRKKAKRLLKQRLMMENGRVRLRALCLTCRMRRHQKSHLRLLRRPLLQQPRSAALPREYLRTH